MVNRSLGMIPSIRLQYSLAFLEVELKKKKKNHWLKHFQNLRIFLELSLFSIFIFCEHWLNVTISRQHGSPLTMSQKNGHKPNAALRGSKENLSQDLGTPLEFQRLRACPYSAGAWVWSLVAEPRLHVPCGAEKMTPHNNKALSQDCSQLAGAGRHWACSALTLPSNLCRSHPHFMSQETEAWSTQVAEGGPESIWY